MSMYPRFPILIENSLNSNSKNVETATEEIFGTISSLDTMQVHPHIVSEIRFYL